jgi:Fe2+ or Zn2+ uptake regulation protein
MLNVDLPIADPIQDAAPSVESTPVATAANNAAFPAPIPTPSLNELIARLRRSGLRLTPGRRTMLGGLLKCHGPVTLSQLQVTIRPQRVPLATLFRSMLRLEEIELVTRTIDLNGTANWQLNLGRPRAFQITRRDNGQVDTLDAETSRPLAYLLGQLEQRLRQRGYTHLQLSVAFRGMGATPRTEALSAAAPAAVSHVAA